MIIKKNRKQTQGADSTVQEGEEQQSIQKEEEIDLFDLDNIDFKQRNERRRGDRRRGFRRIDDRNLISRAREEANSIREAASKEGYQAGIDLAGEDIALLKENLSVFFGAKQEVYEAIAPDILEISLDIAKKIIKKEVQDTPEVLTNNVQEILKTYSKGEGSVTIKVNPSQVDLLKQNIPDILNTIGSDSNVKVVADETIMEGGCLVTTENGVIDATIETQLSIISEALKEV